MFYIILKYILQNPLIHTKNAKLESVLWTYVGSMTIWRQDTLEWQITWYRGQFGIMDNLAPLTIWYHNVILETPFCIISEGPCVYF